MEPRENACNHIRNFMCFSNLIVATTKCDKHVLSYSGLKNAKAIQCPKIKDKNRQTNTTPWRTS